MTAPLLTISIVNHSNAELLRDCLRSIVAGTTTPAEIWVIDNATDGRLVPEMRAEFPHVRWIFNERRLGFSANHNQVLSHATTPFALILNDDTVVHAGAIDTMVAFARANPRVGILGPRLLNADGSIQDSTFRRPTLRSELIDVCLLPGRLASWKRVAIDPAGDGDAPADVDWLLGACLLIRREVLHEVGLLDAILSPVANVEEVDWCRRARAAGWRVTFLPSARVTHLGGQSMKPDDTAPPVANAFRIEMYRARLAYFAKHDRPLRALLLRAIYVLTLPWNLLMLTQSRLRGRLSRREAITQAATLRGIARVACRPRRLPAKRASPEER